MWTDDSTVPTPSAVDLHFYCAHGPTSCRISGRTDVALWPTGQVGRERRRRHET